MNFVPTLLGPVLLWDFFTRVGSAVVLRFGPASEWIVWPIPALILPFVGVFYPLAVLPGWMRVTARFLPPAYVFEGMRSTLAGHPFAKVQLLYGALLAVAWVLLAYRLFARAYRRAVRTGLIARYSAESLS
ncbi:MAG TPA: hypothetical protein VGI81_25540 [Tepidisphaeraceae bacterium]|jgi:ABC-2 type transport system permease protein